MTCLPIREHHIFFKLCRASPLARVDTHDGVELVVLVAHGSLRWFRQWRLASFVPYKTNAGRIDVKSSFSCKLLRELRRAQISLTPHI